MKALSGLSRRRFVAALGTLFGVVLLPSCGPSRESRELGGRLTGVLPTRDRWRLVGEVYLEAHPDERHLEELLAGLLDDLGWDPLVGSDDDLARQVAQRVRRDFREGRTVLVEGWVLSATEARLATVASLL